MLRRLTRVLAIPAMLLVPAVLVTLVGAPRAEQGAHLLKCDDQWHLYTLPSGVAIGYGANAEDACIDSGFNAGHAVQAALPRCQSCWILPGWYGTCNDAITYEWDGWVNGPAFFNASLGLWECHSVWVSVSAAKKCHNC